MTGMAEPVPEVVRAVQAVDPSASPEAVARYMAEIAEMASELMRVDVDEQPLASGYSPEWLGQEERGS
jgi:hypothetical protein